MKSRRRDGTPGLPCDYCDGGRVRREIRRRELIRVGTSDYVALERVPVGVCDRCKARYYHVSVLKQAEALHGRRAGRRTVKVPVARFVEAG